MAGEYPVMPDKQTTPETENVTLAEKTSVENISIGRDSFIAVESPGKLSFIDNNKRRIDLLGDFDTKAVKKDIIKHFAAVEEQNHKNNIYSSKTSNMDISVYAKEQNKKGNALYQGFTETLYGMHPLRNKEYMELHNKGFEGVRQPDQKPVTSFEHDIETAKKTGYVQGVCECVGIVSSFDQNMGKKLLSEMNVTKDMAQKFAKPETYKALENGIFSQQQEQKREQTQGIRR
jgi:hypothetical protein